MCLAKKSYVLILIVGSGLKLVIELPERNDCGQSE